MTGLRWAVSDSEAQMWGRQVGFFLSESGWNLGRVASSQDPCGFHDPLHPAWRPMLALWTGYDAVSLSFIRISLSVTVCFLLSQW